MNLKCVNYHFHYIIDFFVCASRLKSLIETEDSEVVHFKNYKDRAISICIDIPQMYLDIYNHLTGVFIKRLTDGSIYSFHLCSLQKQSFQTMQSVKSSL